MAATRDHGQSENDEQVMSWRETPLFRHWRKPRQPSLAKGWRKRYRWFRWPVAYPKARTITCLRYRQMEPGRENIGLQSRPAMTFARRSA